jgi:hypothetical protein
MAQINVFIKEDIYIVKSKLLGLQHYNFNLGGVYTSELKAVKASLALEDK